MLFCGVRVHVPFYQPACAKLMMDGCFFGWTGNQSNGQYQCIAEQENHTGPAGCILTLPHNVVWGIGQKWQALFGLFMPSVFKSCTQTAPIGLICTWCTAVVAFLGQCTRTIASEYTVSIPHKRAQAMLVQSSKRGHLHCPLNSGRLHLYEPSVLWHAHVWDQGELRSESMYNGGEH